MGGDAGGKNPIAARGNGLSTFSLSATRVGLPGVVSETGMKAEAQFLVQLTTPRDPKGIRIRMLHRCAGVIRDFRSQCMQRTGVA